MNRTALVTTLEMTGHALAENQMIPVMSCFCFDGETVRAYNDTIGVIAPCECPIQFVTHGPTLLGLLKACQADEVTFKLEGQDVVVKAGKSLFTLPWSPVDEFIFEEQEAWNITLKLNSDLLQGLAACLTTSSKDLAQPAWAGVSLKGDCAYSFDGDTITKKKLAQAALTENIMLPNAFCQAVLKIVDESEPGNAGLNLGNYWVMAALTNGYRIYGRLIQNDTPMDYEEFINDTLVTQPDMVPVPAMLHQALVRARVVADPVSAPTQLIVEGGKLRMRTSTHMGVVNDVMAFGHPDVTANVSAEKVQQALELCNEMAIMENCSAFTGEGLLQITGNME